MNKRIKEMMPKPWTFPYPDRELYTKEQFEYFAKSIIQECANIASVCGQIGVAVQILELDNEQKN